MDLKLKSLLYSNNKINKTIIKSFIQEDLTVENKEEIIKNLFNEVNSYELRSKIFILFYSIIDEKNFIISDNFMKFMITNVLMKDVKFLKIKNPNLLKKYIHHFNFIAKFFDKQKLNKFFDNVIKKEVLSNICTVLYFSKYFKFKIENNDFLKKIEKEVNDSKPNSVIFDIIFNYVDEKFIIEVLFPIIKKNIKRSINNFNFISKFFKCLNNVYKNIDIDQFLEFSFYDSFLSKNDSSFDICLSVIFDIIFHKKTKKIDEFLNKLLNKIILLKDQNKIKKVFKVLSNKNYINNHYNLIIEYNLKSLENNNKFDEESLSINNFFKINITNVNNELIDIILTPPKTIGSLQFKLWFIYLNKNKLNDYEEKIIEFYKTISKQYYDEITKNSIKKLMSLYPFYLCGLYTESLLNNNKNIDLFKNKSNYLFSPQFFEKLTNFEVNILFLYLNNIIGDTKNFTENEFNLYSLLYFNCLIKNNLNNDLIKKFLKNIHSQNLFFNILYQLLLKEEKISNITLKNLISIMISNFYQDIEYTTKELFIIGYLCLKCKIKLNNIFQFVLNTDINIIDNFEFVLIFNSDFIISDNYYKKELFSKLLSFFFLIKNENVINVLELIFSEVFVSKIYHKNEILNKLKPKNIELKNIIKNDDLLKLFKDKGFIEDNIENSSNNLNLLGFLSELKDYDSEEEELTLYHQKYDLEEKFGILMKQIIISLEFFFENINKIKNIKNKFINEFYLKIYPSLIKLCFNNIYDSYFEILINKSTSYLFLNDNKLKNYINTKFYNILKYEYVSNDLKILEENLVDPNLKNEINLNLSFSFFKELIKFVFEILFDMNVKKNCFSVLIEIIKINLEYKFIFEFIVKNMNNLFFDNIEILIVDIINIASEKNINCLDLLIKNLLNYQDFARKISLNVLLKTNQINYEKFKIDSINKINIMILTEVENEEICDLAKEVVKKIPQLKLILDNLLEIDYKEMILNYPFDMHLMFNKIISNIFKESNNEGKEKFINLFVKQSHEIIDLIKKDKVGEIEDLEEKLKFIPNLIDYIKNQLDIKTLVLGISIIFELETLYLKDLTEYSLNSLNNIISSRKDVVDELLNYLKNKLNNQDKKIFPIIVMGKCVQLKNVKQNFDLEKQVFNLSLIMDFDYQKRLSKFLSYLVPIFSEPENIIKKLLLQIKNIKDEEEIKCNLMFLTGLIKGLGIKYLIKLNIIGEIKSLIKNSKKKNLSDIDNIKKIYIINMINSLWHNFKRLLEPLFEDIIEIIITFFSEYKENIRNVSINLLNEIMQNISGYGIKICLPILLNGCKSEKNTFSRINSISGLKCIAYLGTKQLSNHLPILVPELTKGTIDSNLDIKRQSIETLEVILGTIKNPEISNMKEFIIKSLTNPYEDNWRALEVLLNINFHHYFDSSSLSLIIPIILYGLNNERNSKSRKMAAQVLANISHLIKNDDDILAYLEKLIETLKFASTDLLSEVRATVAKSISSLCKRFGNKIINSIINTFKEVLENEKSTSISKAGAAQCFAEALNYLDKNKQIEIINNCLALTKNKNELIKESFISVFVYLPIIMDRNYKPFIKETIDNIVESLSCEDEKIRSMAIKSIKGIIQKFYLEEKETIIKPLLKTSFSDNPTKRYCSIILIGDIIEFINNRDQLKDKQKLYNENKKMFSLIYIMKNDKNNEVRNCSTNIWKIFVNNPGKILRLLCSELIQMIINLSISDSLYHQELFALVMQEFIVKYCETLINLILENLIDWKNKCEDYFLLGICKFIKQIFLNQKKSILIKIYDEKFKKLIEDLFNTDDRKILKIVFEFYEIFLKKSKINDFALSLLEEHFNILQNLTGDETSQYSLDIIENFINYNIPFLNKIIFENILVKGEFAYWKTDLLRNCADIFGQKFFKEGLLKNGITFFYEQYIKHDNKLIKENLIMTTKNLIVHIDKEFSIKLINDLSFNLKKFCIKKNNDGIIYNLELISYLFEKSDLIYQNRIEIIDSLMELFYNLNLDNEILDILGNVFDLFKNDIFNNQWRILAEKMKIYLTLEKGKKSLCYSNSNIISNLIIICLDGLKIGNDEIIKNLLKCLKCLIKNTNVNIIENNLKKLLGNLVRLLTYNLEEDKALSYIKILDLWVNNYEIGTFFDNIMYVLVNNLNLAEEKESFSLIYFLMEKIFEKNKKQIKYIRFWKLRCLMEENCQLVKLENFIEQIKSEELKKTISKEFNEVKLYN